MMRVAATWSLAIGLTIATAALAWAETPPPTIPAVALGAAWISIPLPDMPLGIAAHDGDLWVCGANEMLAVSTDGGRNWTMKHWRPGGEMLFSIAFPGPQQIAVFGTAGTWLESKDGGTSWKEKDFTPSAGLAQVAFGSSSRIYGAGGRRFGWSDDGGAHWLFRYAIVQPAKGSHAGGSQQDFRFVEQVAAVGQQQAAFLFDADPQVTPRPPQIVAATADGGRHWQQVTLPNRWSWAGLRTDNKGYHLYGVDKGTGAGAAVKPAQALSHDGLHWSLEAAPTTYYDNCQQQGCLLRGGWVDLSGPAPRMWQLTDDAASPLTAAWAAAGQTFCRVSATLRCRVGAESWTGPPADPDNLYSDNDIGKPQCRVCPSPIYPVDARWHKEQGTVSLSIRVGTNGHVQQAVVIAAPSASLALSALNRVRGWVYTDPAPSGMPLAFDSVIFVNYSLRN